MYTIYWYEDGQYHDSVFFIPEWHEDPDEYARRYFLDFITVDMSFTVLENPNGEIMIYDQDSSYWA